MDMHAAMVRFSFDYTFGLNLLFGAAGLALFVIARRHSMGTAGCEHHAGHGAGEGRHSHG